MWYNILSTSVNFTPTNATNWSAIIDTGQSTLQLIRFLHQLSINWTSTELNQGCQNFSAEVAVEIDKK